MKKAITVALAGVLAAATLAGCSPSPRVVTSVNGATLDEAVVQADTAAMAKITGEDPTEIRLTIVMIHSMGLAAQEVAKSSGVELTSQEKALVISQNKGMTAWKDTPEAQGFVNSYATYALARAKMGDNGFLAACSQLDVKLNPRYGNWVPSKCAVDGNPGSLSVASK